MSSSFVVVTLTVLLLLTSVFMILLVLVQRGRGGGLAGAFGGMGGQSAFGTRAGDVFTKITVVVAIIFILLASLLGKSMRAAQRDADHEINTQYDAPVDEDAESNPQVKTADDNDTDLLTPEADSPAPDSTAPAESTDDQPADSAADEATDESGDEGSAPAEDADAAADAESDESADSDPEPSSEDTDAE